MTSTPEEMAEYAKLLSELYPSAYSRKRAAFQALRANLDPKRQRTSPSGSDSDSDFSVSDESEENAPNSNDSECTGTSSDETSDEEHVEPDEVKEQRITLIVRGPGRRDESSDEEQSDSSDSDMRKQNQDTLKAFKKLLRGKTSDAEVEYFSERLTNEEQRKAVEELGRLASLAMPSKPYSLQLLDLDIPDSYKAIAYRKMVALRDLEPGSGEYHKLKQWLTTLMRIPFGKYKNLPVSLAESSIQDRTDFMSAAKSTMDAAVFGLDDVKEQVYQLLGQWISNPRAIGTAIAIEGPMGTGKTTLVKEGISKALGRDFVFIALGGATDSSFLEGHSYTYEGAVHGNIVDGLTRCDSMNPVFFFDELDKVSDTARGQEIIGILTHLTDTSQNKEFHDKYFSEITFDLSRALFVFSYNDASLVNPILKDRMHKLSTRGYKVDEKVCISRGYLIPASIKKVGFEAGDIVLTDEVLQHIIGKHTHGEQGVRNLQRCLAAIYTKLNLFRMVSVPGDFIKTAGINAIKVPITPTIKEVDALLGKKQVQETWKLMYM